MQHQSHILPVGGKLPKHYRHRFILCCQDLQGKNHIAFEIKALPPQSVGFDTYDSDKSLFSQETVDLLNSYWTDFSGFAMTEILSHKKL